MPHEVVDVNRQAVRQALRASGALGARWTDHWDCKQETEWYWVICDNKEYDIDGIASRRARRGVRKGLRECRVKQLESQEFAQLAYPLFCQSLKSYGVTPESKQEFARKTAMQAKFRGSNYWGVFVGEDLAAYATCRILDNAVIISTTKSDPALRKHCTNNALLHAITLHYLRNNDISYITNGCRTTYHSTDMNEFLERMGYRRVYARLNIELTPRAQLAVWAGKCRCVLRLLKMNRRSHPYAQQLEALAKLKTIADSIT